MRGVAQWSVSTFYFAKIISLGPNKISTKKTFNRKNMPVKIAKSYRMYNTKMLDELDILVIVLDFV